jgi:hypothetical protein
VSQGGFLQHEKAASYSEAPRPAAPSVMTPGIVRLMAAGGTGFHAAVNEVMGRTNTALVTAAGGSTDKRRDKRRPPKSPRQVIFVVRVRQRFARPQSGIGKLIYSWPPCSSNWSDLRLSGLSVRR